MTRYVTRDNDGNPIGHFAYPNGTAHEEVADDDPAVIAFETSGRFLGALVHVEPIPTRDLHAEFDALKALLVEKQLVTKAEIDSAIASGATELKVI